MFDIKEAADALHSASWNFTPYDGVEQLSEHKNITWIPYHLDVTQHNVTVVSDTIEYILAARCPDQAVVFFWRHEGYAADVIRFMNAVCEILLLHHGYDRASFYYTTSATDCPKNHEIYKKLFRYFPYLPNNVFFDPIWEVSQIPECNTVIEHDPSCNDKSKLFLSLNGQPRPHRLALLGMLHKRRLFDLGYVSAFNFHSPVGDFSSVDMMYPKYTLDIQDAFTELAPGLPINLTLMATKENMHRLNEEDIKLYKSSLFSLVAETLFHSDVDDLNQDHSYYNNLLCFPCILMSEKIWKPIRASHPFIVYATPHFLSDLRDLGYKTFHPYINEEYDLLEDPEQRLTAILHEVERLSKLTEEETIKWWQAVSQIAEFNYHTLKSSTRTITLRKIYL